MRIKSFLADIFFAMIGLVSPTQFSNRAVILMYHSVSHRNDRFFTVSPEMFTRHMNYLFEHRYRVISLNELVHRLRNKMPLNGEVVITFDDGYKDNLSEAFPVLQKLHFPATIFVTTGLIGKKDQHGFEMLSVEDIRQLSGSDLITLAPHSVTHPKLAKLSPSDVEQELLESKSMLEGLTGKVCDLFAYPYGSFSEDTVSIARTMQFSAAVTVKPGSIGSTDNLFTLHRNPVDSATSFVQFKGKLNVVTDCYESLKQFFL